MKLVNLSSTNSIVNVDNGGKGVPTQYSAPSTQIRTRPNGTSYTCADKVSNDIVTVICGAITGSPIRNITF